MPKPEPSHERRRFFPLGLFLQERRKRNLRALLVLVLAVLAFRLCDQYFLGTGRVIDVSMLPTLRQGRYLLIQKWPYRLRSPRRGEIVVLRPPGETRWTYIKRVVGLGGETLRIRHGDVYINNRILKEPYAAGKTKPELGPLEIPKDSYFVLGDNRADSEDSRHFGTVPRNRIFGKI